MSTFIAVDSWYQARSEEDGTTGADTIETINIGDTYTVIGIDLSNRVVYLQH